MSVVPVTGPVAGCSSAALGAPVERRVGIAVGLMGVAGVRPEVAGGGEGDGLGRVVGAVVDWEGPTGRGRLPVGVTADQVRGTATASTRPAPSAATPSSR